MKSNIVFSSENMGWITPEKILSRVGEIDCDPCTWEDNPTNARVFYTIKEDGLAQPWSLTGKNFINPPYGHFQIAWIKKTIAESLRGAESELLIPAKTETKVWQDWVFPTANAICFIRARLSFIDPATRKPRKAPAPFPSAQVYYGKDVDSFRARFSDIGTIVTTR